MTSESVSNSLGDQSAVPQLRRSIDLLPLTLYGLGVTVGAGIYVLIGATVAQAGPFAWMAFLLAALVVAFTAFSYAELVTRYPVSAGEAAYVDAGFGKPALATIAGLLVAGSGMISASAISVGAAGYLNELTGVSASPLIVCVVGSMALLAWWGITQSVLFAAVITVIEILGLICVIAWGLFFSEHNGVASTELLPSLNGSQWSGIFGASLLAFFAFIGFEDMVNVAEEVKEPRRNMPRAILYTLLISTALYVAISITLLIAVPIEQLAGSPTALTQVFVNAPNVMQSAFASIAVIATVNGVLIQMIMSSRVLYGMANRNQLPRWLAQVSTRTQTPGVATALVAICIVSLGLFLPIERLAEWTSLVVLGVFVLVNAALVEIKRHPNGDDNHFTVPIGVPIFGILSSLALLATSLI